MRNVAGPEPSSVVSGAPGTHTEIETRRWNTVQVLLFVLTVAVVTVSLHQGRAFFIPVTLGLFLTALFWPLHAWMTRVVPRWVSATAVILIVLVAMALLAGAVWFTVDSVSTKLRESSDELAAKYAQFRSTVEASGLDARWLPELSGDGGSGAAPSDGDAGPNSVREPDGGPRQAGAGTAAGAAAGFAGLPPQIAQWAVSFVTSGLGSLGWIAAVVGLAVFLMVLLLLEIPRWGERLERLARPDAAENVKRAAREVSYQVSRYLLVKAITGAIAGVLVGLWCWAMGVSFPVTWGLLQFLFNFVPNVGAFISGIPPTILAFLEIGMWQAVAFGLGLVVIETLIGNIVDPVLEGNAMRLSPFVVLGSLTFWGWLWGAIGALLAVPITAAILVVLLHTPRLRPLGEFIRDTGVKRRPRKAAG